MRLTRFLNFTNSVKKKSRWFLGEVRREESAFTETSKSNSFWKTFRGLLCPLLCGTRRLTKGQVSSFLVINLVRKKWPWPLNTFKRTASQSLGLKAFGGSVNTYVAGYIEVLRGRECNTPEFGPPTLTIHSFCTFSSIRLETILISTCPQQADINGIEFNCLKTDRDLKSLTFIERLYANHPERLNPKLYHKMRSYSLFTACHALSVCSYYYYNLHRIWMSPKSTSVSGLTWAEPWAPSMLISLVDDAQEDPLLAPSKNVLGTLITYNIQPCSSQTLYILGEVDKISDLVVRGSGVLNSVVGKRNVPNW